ncbi:hypothetical protein A2U01_0094119, partial [Trifolium medium]|nr:hypothetical protein [Trifolium medium]
NLIRKHQKSTKSDPSMNMRTMNREGIRDDNGGAAVCRRLNSRPLLGLRGEADGGEMTTPRRLNRCP